VEELSEAGISIVGYKSEYVTTLQQDKENIKKKERKGISGVYEGKEKKG
jgi:hypothetical protein